MVAGYNFKYQREASIVPVQLFAWLEARDAAQKGSSGCHDREMNNLITLQSIFYYQDGG